MAKITIVGLDGATFRIISPLVEKGELPTIKKLMEEGAFSELESTIHPLSPPAWASFMTGKNPGKHGIFEFVEFKPYSYELQYINGGFVHGKKLWEILSESGKRVCVVNVPFTYPPKEVNGYLIAGLDAPGIKSRFCYPPELLDELTKKFGEYQLRQHPYKATPENYLNKILDQFDYILKVAKYLKAREPWDFFMVVFEATDLVQHFYWHYAFPEDFDISPTQKEILKDAIFNVYKRIDKGLEEFLELCSDDIVMVMSDHGFSPCRKIFFMDNWLHKHGYLTYCEEDKKSYKFTRLLHLSFQKYFPNRFKGWVTSLMPGLKDKVRSYLSFSTIDWFQTKAFSLGIDSTNIFINVKGRFPQGIVAVGKEYEALRDEIAQKLKDLKDPETGERIVANVYKREEIYHGECLHKAPDLLVTWKNFEYNTRKGYGREGDGLFGSSLEFSDVSAYSSLQKSGTHHIKGIFIAKGNPIKNIAFEGAKIIDLAPTILYLLGEKIPQDMDGRVLKEIIEEDFLSSHSIQFKDKKKEELVYIQEKQQGSGVKVLLIGLDGATFDLIDPWIKAGKLPTLAKCIKKGARSILLSTPLPNSAQAWSTLVTGKNPGKHGIFDFFERIPNSYDIRFVNASFRKAKALWKIISDSGKRVGVMNVPMTYPAEEVNGFIICGLDSPGIDKKAIYPPHLIHEIKKHVGQYIIEPGIWGFIRKGQLDVALNKLLETIKVRTAVAKYLMTKYPWEFFMIVFTESDKVQHHFWKFMESSNGYSQSEEYKRFKDAILKVYEALDSSLKELLELIDDETYVFIVSDHGAGPSTNRTFYINKWLNSEGFLAFKKPSINEVIQVRTIRLLDRWVKKRLSRRTKELLVRMFPQVRGKVESILSLSGIDWQLTKAYSYENHSAIFINLKGREPEGIVPPEDFEKVRREICEKLTALRCPETQEKIVEDIILKEDVYWGEEVDKAPDIIFKWKEYRYIHRPSDPFSKDGFIKILSHKEMEISEAFHRPSGVHREEGIFIAIGKGIKEGTALSSANLMDIAPTVLYTIGLPVPNDMDGKVLIDIFKDEFIKDKPVHVEKGEDLTIKTTEVYNAEEEKIIQERLRGLGYID